MDPTEVLENEHRLIERAVRVVAFTATAIKSSQDLPPQHLREIVDFMQRYVAGYHQSKEDSILFELLEKKGVSEHGCPLAPLRNEHHKIQVLTAELADTVTAYENSKLAGESIANILTGLEEIYPHHLWIENFLLFPMTNKLLNNDEKETLNQKFDQVNATRKSVAQEMAKQVEKLESTIRALSANFTSAEGHEHPGPQRTPEATCGTAIEFSLNDEAERLRQEPAWKYGRSAKTLIKYSDLRVVLTTARAGQILTEHRNPSRTYIQSLNGHLRLEALDKTFDLPAGPIVALDRDVPHHIVAIEDSTFLVIVVWPGWHPTEIAPVAAARN